MLKENGILTELSQTATTKLQRSTAGAFLERAAADQKLKKVVDK